MSSGKGGSNVVDRAGCIAEATSVFPNGLAMTEEARRAIYII